MNHYQAKLLIFTLLLCACSARSLPPAAMPTVNRPGSQVITPTPTLSIQSQKEEILDQIKQRAQAYNALIEDEKNQGSYELVDLGQGKQGFEFTGSSYIRISAKFNELIKAIEALNQRYLQLSPKKAPAPPAFTSRDEGQAYLSNLIGDYNTWFFNESRHGETVTVYNPEAMEYAPQLIGNSYRLAQAKHLEISNLRLWLRIPSADGILQDLQLLKRLDPGDITFVDVSSLPFYRKDLSLTQYESATRTYLVYSETHIIISVVPMQIPLGISNLPADELEDRARTLIALFFPGEAGGNLDQLTPAHGSKIGTFFFRWEDRTKPLLDDGRSYPFIQVGLNGNGELLNYVNTLPLAR